MGALVRRGRKNEWKLDRVMHALTQAMIFFLSRSLAHPVPCDYAQAYGKWSGMTPHGYLFRLYRVEGPPVRLLGYDG